MAQDLTTITTTHILDQLKEGVIVVESDGTIQYLNQSAQNLLALEQEPGTLYEAVAPYESWQELIHSDGLSYLYIDSGRIEVQTSPIDWNNKPAKQLTLSAGESADSTLSEAPKLKDQLASLNRISLQLGSTLRLTDILRAITDEALSNTGADGGRISLYDQVEKAFIPRFSRGEIAANEITTDYEMAFLTNQESVIKRNLPKVDNNKVCSALFCPILYEGVVAGSISLHSLRKDYFTEQTQTYVQALANHAALAIGNARRFEELNSRSSQLHDHAQQIEQFVESSRVLHGDRPLTEIYEDLVYAIQEGLGYQIVILNLIDEEIEPANLRIISAAGLPIDQMQEILGTSQPWEQVAQLLRPEFQVGPAFYIPAEKSAAYAEVETHQFSEVYEIPKGQEPFYNVAYVEEGGVLNVRQEPGITKPIVGTLPFDAEKIRVTGPPKVVDNSVWVPVQHDNLIGWVNERYLKSDQEMMPLDWHEDDLFIIPLNGSEGKPIGLISLDNPNNGRRPDQNTIKALEIFANQAATAVENTRLFHNTREYADLLQQLHLVSQEILQERDFKKQLTLIINGLQSAGWGRVSLTLRDKDLNATLLVSTGLVQEDEAFLRDNMLPPAVWRERLTDEAYQAYKVGSAYFMPADDPWVNEKIGIILPDNSTIREDPDAWHPNDLLYLPLYDRQQNVISLISLDEPTNGLRPTTKSLQIVELYVQVATPIIENAQLYQETQRQLTDLQTVNEISQAISTVLDLKELMETIGHSLSNAFNANSYYISLYNPEDDTLSFPLLIDKEVPLEIAPIPADRGPTNYIYRSGQPFLVNKKSDWKRLDNEGYGEMSESYLGVPMRSGDQVIGVLAVQDYNKTYAYNLNDMNILSTIASQAAVAVENARLVSETIKNSEELRTLFEDTYQRERFFAALGRVSLAINATFDLPTVLNLICQESLSLFNVDGAYIWQLQQENLVGIAAAGHAQEDFVGTNIMPEEPFVFASTVAKSGESTFTNQFKKEKNIQLRLPAQASIEAVLGIPLTKENETIGVLVLIDQSVPERFGPRDIEQATVFGVQGAIAIQNAQLVTEMRQLNEELDERVAKRTLALGQERDRVQYLLRVTTELTASLDEDRVLSRALELVNEVVNATQGGILLYDPEVGKLVYRAAFGDQAPYLVPQKDNDFALKFDEGLANWMIRNRKPIIIDDTLADKRWASQSESPEHRSVLAVPLISSDEVIGILMLFHKEPLAFSKEQLDLVEAAAFQVASAINNAQLFLLIRDQAERLGTMLREEQVEAAKMQAMLESIADGVIVTDADGEVILANRPSSLILDIPRVELIGKTLNELLGLYRSTEESWIQTIDAWSNRTKRPHELPHLADRLNIEDLVVSVQLSPVFANNQFFGTVSIFRDITQEVEVDRMKSEFVSTVSHELRTPMTSIKGYAELILMGAAGKMTDPQVRYMQVIKSNADRLSMLVNDLLDISRIETGKTELDLRPLDVPQIIEQVVEGHLRGRIKHEEKEIDVRTEMAPSLPLVHADHARVTQILTNLLDNAYHYTPSNGKITVNVRANGEYVFISISDTGIGISQDNHQKIFERFFRAEDSDVQKVAGTGLGLSIVRSLIEMHGGKIEVNSVPGEGSTFTFNLPQVAEDTDIV